MKSNIPGEDKFPIPKGRPKETLPGYEVKQLAKEMSKVRDFAPSDMQERVKARFFRNLASASHVHDLESAVKDAKVLEKLSGTRKIHDWIKQEDFAEWFLNEGHFQDSAQALMGKALQKVKDILEDSFSENADVIKAAKLVFELTGAAAPKKQEVRFLDERIEAMPLAEVEAETKRIQEQLKAPVKKEEQVDLTLPPIYEAEEEE